MNKKVDFHWIENHYHIKRQSLGNRIKKLSGFKQKFMTKQGNKWLINTKGLPLITYTKHNSTSPFRHTRKGVKSKTPSKNDYYWMNQKLTKIIGSQQKTITHQQNVISKITTYNLRLSNRNIKLDKIQGKSPKALKQPKSSSHGFLWKLFH